MIRDIAENKINHNWRIFIRELEEPLNVYFEYNSVQSKSSCCRVTDKSRRCGRCRIVLLILIQQVGAKGTEAKNSA